MNKPWSEINAIYQIYPRSFMDANGDGIGDLRGVIDRLDYFKGKKDSLGIDAIWFSPIYPSPMVDFGYDVSNYRDIDPTFGTLDDFKELIAKAHERGVAVMLDFVPNHSSDQHPWFIESRSSRDNPKRDYYTWADPKPDGSPPNNWISIFGGSAWEFDKASGQYYMHTFFKEQPDLNWDNPAVRAEMAEILRFWLDLGVDGFRADAVRYMAKDAKLRDDPKNKKWQGKPGAYESLIQLHSRFGKQLFPYLREMTDVISQYDNRIMIFEDYPDGNFDTKEQYLGFYSIDPKVSMPFNFEGMWTNFDAESFRRFITDFQGMLNQDEHTPVYCFGNHDNPRLVSRIGSEQARAIAVMQLALPGIPIVYYGDELGMPNGELEDHPMKDKVSVENTIGGRRDLSRTPMQWDASEHGGFTRSEPWLPAVADLEKLNVEKELAEHDSFLSLYRRMLKLRSQHDIFTRGDYETFGEADPNVFVFSRRLNDQHVFIAINFSDKPQTYKLPHYGRVLCCSHPVDYPDVSDDGEIGLRPYEASIIECSEHPLKKD